MNESLELYARKQIKECLRDCNKEQVHFFKRLYSHDNLKASIDDVVNNIPAEKLSWALSQVEKTVSKNIGW